jgi:hypothetical protein
MPDINTMKTILLGLLLLCQASFAQESITFVQAMTNIVVQPSQMGEIIGYVQNIRGNTNSITSSNLQWINVVRNNEGTNDYFTVCVIINVPVTNSSSISTNTH